MNLFINNFSHTLAEPWPAGSTADIPLPTEALVILDSIDPGAELRLTLAGEQGHEIISITRPTGQLLIQRGLEGTTDQSWPAETRAYAALTAGLLNELAAGAPVTSVTAGETQQIDYRLARRWVVSITQDSLLSLLPAPAGTQLEIFCVQDEAGDHTVQLPEGVTWQRRTEPIIDKGAGCVTHLLLTSLGSTWLGHAEIYGEAPPAEIFLIYFVAHAFDENYAQGHHLIARDALGEDLFAEKLADLPSGSYSDYSSCAAVSPDNRYAAAFNGSYDLIAVVNIETGQQVVADISVYYAQPARPTLQFANDCLYTLSDDGLISIDADTGAVTNIELDGLQGAQGFSVSGETIAVTHNRRPASAALGTPPVTLYSLATGELLADQFPLPDGSWLGTEDVDPYSPSGAAGAFSPDGTLYALNTLMAFGETLEDAVDGSRFIVYDVATRAPLHEFEVEGMQGYASHVVWSRNGRYVLATCDDSSGSADSACYVIDMGDGSITAVGSAGLDNAPAVVTDDGIVVSSTTDPHSEPRRLAYSAATGQPVPLPVWAEMPELAGAVLGLASA